VLSFETNQFGFQGWFAGDEILNSLKYVRPGNNFETKATMMERTEVVGANAHPLFKRLQQVLPFRNTSLEYEMANPKGTQKNEQFLKAMHSPVHVSDIVWNFEWFLIGPDGTPVQRYHSDPAQHEKQLEDDLDKLFAAAK